MHNFSPGPARLPDPVREQLAEEFGRDALDRPSVVEISHRGPRFAGIAERLIEGLGRLTGVADTHEVLLLQGGAHLQFAMLPMNLARDRTAAFMLTGHWGTKALQEATRVTRTAVVASSADDGWRGLPELAHLPPDCAYLHYTGNETIHGVQFPAPPAAGVPLAADLSSEFLSRPYAYDSLGVAYACAQKNLGVAGLTVVLVRRELLERVPDDLPAFLDYRCWARSGSLANTPCTFAWYVAALVIDWIDSLGGLEAVERMTRARARRVYAAIDASDFYRNDVDPEARSVMNVPFFLADPDLTGRFVADAEAAGLYGLKGHRAVGGLRASLYNAQTDRAVDELLEFMADFERRRG